MNRPRWKDDASELASMEDRFYQPPDDEHGRGCGCDDCRDLLRAERILEDEIRLDAREDR